VGAADIVCLSSITWRKSWVWMCALARRTQCSGSLKRIISHCGNLLLRDRYDRWEQFNLYRRSDVLQNYVLVDTDRVEIALTVKSDRSKWEITRYVAGNLVKLKSINLIFQIEQLFEKIVFAPELKS
jgi:hypothetical protein